MHRERRRYHSWLHSLLLLVLCVQVVACGSSSQPIILNAVETEVTDSSTSQLQRPYGVGYNLVVHSDSLLLQEDRPMHWCQGVAETSDSLWVMHGEQIVVAAITVIPEDCVDSVWVKVARDQSTMGWTHEHDLLADAWPDDPISYFINIFSSQHVFWFVVVLACMLAMIELLLWHRRRVRMVLVNDIPSAYPTFLTVVLVVAAWLYAYIQHYVPHLWVQFYFNPTLNPLSQPFVLCAFLFCVWAMVLLALASIENAFSLLAPLDAVLYLFGLLGVCIVIYLIVSLTAWSWLCHVLCLAYIAVALYRYFRFARARYFCGNCQRKLQQKGKCPYCGAIND